jgi:Zn finger protein HypA/HybF involved in hydrogenase expression
MEELTCMWCGYNPIQPEHAHYKCPNCKQRTSCCEGEPICIDSLEEDK